MSATTTITKDSKIFMFEAEHRAMRLDGSDPEYGDWRDDLIRHGFAIVKGAIPRERADQYANAMYTWLENL